jgi:hypothetical protein
MIREGSSITKIIPRQLLNTGKFFSLIDKAGSKALEEITTTIQDSINKFLAADCTTSFAV